MDFLTLIKPIVEKKLLEINYKFNFQDEPIKNSITFDVESDNDIYVLTFWENKTAELTKIKKSTNEIFCDSIEDIKMNGIIEFLNKHFN
tara:strand:+ start:7771 stop:8037 length:267 start_codon:yes stop_codon:yes gene_type:complete